jgi:hypothetical protein
MGDKDAKATRGSEATASDDTGLGMIENGDGNIRRDLSRRHINMIGLAGMIVSQTCPKQNASLPSKRPDNVNYCRERACFSRPGRLWLSPAPSVHFLDISS